jgi:protein O-GlcNAc transferase
LSKVSKWTACFVALVFAFILTIAARAQSPANNSAEAVSLNNRGLQLFQKGNVDEAIALYRQALALRPDFPEALDNLGLALDAKGNDSEAIADFDKALKLKPGDAVTESNRGLALYHEGKYDESIAAYQQAISAHANFPQAYNGMGAAR